MLWCFLFENVFCICEGLINVIVNDNEDWWIEIIFGIKFVSFIWVVYDEECCILLIVCLVFGFVIGIFWIYCGGDIKVDNIRVVYI